MDHTCITGSPGSDLLDFINIWNDPAVESVTMFTSGTTGAPSAIRLDKRDMLVSALSTCSFFGLGPESVLALVLPADRIAGRMVAVRADVCGGRLYVEQPSNHPLADNETIPGMIDLISIVPSQVNGLMQSPALGSVRALLVGGAPLSPSAERKLASVATLASYATYGMTETCSNVALRRLGQPVYVANEGFEFDTDRRGCLVIESETMSFGRLVTNDVVRLHDATHFEWLGRADNVINSSGVKIHPEIVEHKLASVLPPGTFYITSRRSEQWGSEVVLVHECQIDDLLLEQIKCHLDKYERPKTLIKIDAIERAAGGKLRRRKF